MSRRAEYGGTSKWANGSAASVSADVTYVRLMESTTRLGRVAVASVVAGALTSIRGRDRLMALIRSYKFAHQVRAEMSAKPNTKQATSTMQPVATPTASFSAATSVEWSLSANG